MNSYEKEILFSTLAFMIKQANATNNEEAELTRSVLASLGEKCADIASKYQKERTEQDH
jgi:hypothetical protein